MTDDVILHGITFMRSFVQKYSLILIDKIAHIYLATLLLTGKLLWLTGFYVACSQTVYFLFKVGRVLMKKYKLRRIY